MIFPLVGSKISASVNSNQLGQYYDQIKSDVSNAGLGAGIGNMFTGNLDYQRQLALLDKQQEYNTANAAADRAFNAEEAQKARDWQEKQTNTQYLRAAEQLKQLGINPAVLAYGGASGEATAGSTSGTTAHTNTASGASWQRLGLATLANFLGATAQVVNVASKIAPAFKKVRKIGF